MYADLRVSSNVSYVTGNNDGLYTTTLNMSEAKTFGMEGRSGERLEIKDSVGIASDTGTQLMNL